MKKWIIILIIILIILAVIYKINYLNYQEDYNINDNKNDKKMVRDFQDCVEAGGKVSQEYPDQCLYQGDMVFVKKKEQKEALKFNPNDNELVKRLNKLKIKIEKNDDGREEAVFLGYLNLTGDWPVKEWEYSDDFNNPNWNYSPIQNLKINLREMFSDSILSEIDERSKEEILKSFPGFKEEDFKDTGELKYQVDFDILLNNYLIREGLEPNKGEHLEEILLELKNNEQ